MALITANRSAVLQKLFKRANIVKLSNGEYLVKGSHTKPEGRHYINVNPVVPDKAHQALKGQLQNGQDFLFFKDLDNPDGPINMLAHGGPDGKIQYYGNSVTPLEALEHYKTINPNSEVFKKDIDVVSCFSGFQSEYTTNWGTKIKPKYDIRDSIEIEHSMPTSDGSTRLSIWNNEVMNSRKYSGKVPYFKTDLEDYSQGRAIYLSRNASRILPITKSSRIATSKL